MSDHTFQDGFDREINVTLIEAHGYDDQQWTSDDIGENLHEADRIFYELEDDKGESFYRWVAGPFESEADLYDAIQEEYSVYE